MGVILKTGNTYKSFVATLTFTGGDAPSSIYVYKDDIGVEDITAAGQGQFSVNLNPNVTFPEQGVFVINQPVPQNFDPIMDIHYIVYDPQHSPGTYMLFNILDGNGNNVNAGLVAYSVALEIRFYDTYTNL